MRLKLESLAVGISALVLVYLLGVFVAVDFNIANWSEGGRTAVAVIGGFSFFASTMTYYELNSKP